jgi:predicted alpha-1,2-mannosidase
MGNEPGFLIPYLYLYAGAPWRTQKRIRQILSYRFNDTPDGICGDEDGGALSAWYVFSAIGFYPLCPGRPVYGIGSPIFNKSIIKVGDNTVFTIIANNVSAQNKYIQSARLNGEPLYKPWFEHSDIISDGELYLDMGPRPNQEWGNLPEHAPPSLTKFKGEMS